MTTNNSDVRNIIIEQYDAAKLEAQTLQHALEDLEHLDALVVHDEIKVSATAKRVSDIKVKVPSGIPDDWNGKSETLGTKT